MSNQMQHQPDLPAPLTPAVVLVWALAVMCLAGALGMALQHPQSPVGCLVLIWFWCCLAVWRPDAWLWLVPTCLPWLNFSPWTGWVVFEEFDMLLLATLASGYARLGWTGWPSCQARLAPVARWLIVALAVSGGLSFARGLVDAGGFDFDWYAGYSDALNSWRVAKSLLFALLFLPLISARPGHLAGAGGRSVALGMLAGLTVVVVAILWERAAFAGILDFSVHYRTVALFWEMHVGGAAVDVYLVLTAPFVVWALVAAHRRSVWLLAAALAVVTVYAGLTTFSRGVYLAMVLPVTGLVWWLWRRKAALTAARGDRDESQDNAGSRWRFKASEGLSVVLAMEVVAVLVGGSFMSERLAKAGQDLSSRMVHWHNGVSLLHGGSDWVLGKGVGRLPANYAAEVTDGEFSGQVHWHEKLPLVGQKDGYVSVGGPLLNGDLAGAYALTQRVEPTVNGRYRVKMKFRVQAKTRLELYWCERHLLYDRSCQGVLVRLGPSSQAAPDGWQTRVVSLRGPAFASAPWYAPRLKLFSLAVSDADSTVDIDSLELLDSDGNNLLFNGDFSNQTAHWLGAAQSYFDPWHLDNLALELLVERGLLGLLLHGALVVYVLWHLLGRRASGLPLAPYVAAALVAVLLVGLVSSVMDVPRVAFLFYLLLFLSLQPMKIHNRSMVDFDACGRNS